MNFTQTTNPFPTRPSFDEFYDYALNYAMSMEKLSKEPDGTACYYRHGGNACLVGAFLTDEQCVGIEGDGWFPETGLMAAAPAWMLSESGSNALVTIQSIHDESSNVKELVKKLSSERVKQSIKEIYEADTE